MKIAIFDHLVNDSNAIGKCHRELLSRLADKHDFTVFAMEFDNPRPDRIKFVKIPALRYPLLGLMVSFHIIAPIILWWYRRIKKQEFDIVQGIGGNFLGADIAYGHFCHRVYLREHQEARPKKPIRRIYSWLYDSIVSMLEPKIYGDAKYIVTPSFGLAEELERNFKGAKKDKIHIISNPVDLEKMTKPCQFDKSPILNTLGFTGDDMVMVFVGAGHFERKGLPIILEAMSILSNPKVKLIVVGGRNYMINEYKQYVDKLNLNESVQFVGFQKDIRPYVWSSDIFVFPSTYEVFPLVSLEAAAAGLPQLSAPVYGVQEFLVDGYNGWQVERTASAFAQGIQNVLDNPDILEEIGRNARESVQQYSPSAFATKWEAFYKLLEHKLETLPTRPKDLNLYAIMQEREI